MSSSLIDKSGIFFQDGKAHTMQTGINVLALVRGEERYVFLYDDESADQLLRTLGQYAADPDLSFSWYDAAVMSQRIARLRDQQPAATAPASTLLKPARFKEHTR